MDVSDPGVQAVSPIPHCDGVTPSPLLTPYTGTQALK
jgi:hypothetical protein